MKCPYGKDHHHPPQPDHAEGASSWMPPRAIWSSEIARTPRLPPQARPRKWLTPPGAEGSAAPAAPWRRALGESPGTRDWEPRGLRLGLGHMRWLAPPEGRRVLPREPSPGRKPRVKWEPRGESPGCDGTFPPHASPLPSRPPDFAVRRVSGPLQYLLVTLVMAGGALVQGTIGFGMGLFAVPFLVLLNPSLVPGPTLFASGLLTILMLLRERAGIRPRELAWSLGGRVGGTGLAMVVLLAVPAERFGVVFGTLILLAVGLTASGRHVRMTPGTLSAAGLLSGFMATTVSIGGPPMALLYQREPGPSLRATLSAFFVVGTALSLLGLNLVGRFGWAELALGASLLPGILLGFGLAVPLTRRLDGRALRPVILGVCAVTGLMVLVEAVRP